MAPRRLATNALAFIGPFHVPELTEFCYVRVRNIEGETAIVHVVGPDQMTKDTRFWSRLHARASYIAHPGAFIHPSGPCVGQWAYGVVVRYEVKSQGTWLSVISGGQAVSVALAEPLRVIKADPITYALQIGATVSDMVLNPKELLSCKTQPFKRVGNGKVITWRRSVQSFLFPSCRTNL
ncbi:hypothetical protein PHMEG_00025012 [Phytophthora megakarya]|uniref:Uncharacterized protein n=1 Tax=Phytophthora megakarya TaxID=4795 RepID=A0A225VEQ5_9STRA|nr:hypothetical protein PHMEG_00025012 [Phytophthora megakarya]